MKYSGICIMVEDMDRAKDFYTGVLGQKIVMDMGRNVTFEGGYSLQSDYESLMGIPKDTVVQRSNSFELYFEAQDLDSVIERLKSHGAEFVHGKKEAPWGQFSFLISDPDGHLIEIGETMHSLVGRLATKGLAPEEISQKTSLPVPAVIHFMKTDEN